MNVTWRQLILLEMENHHETWDDVVDSVMAVQYYEWETESEFAHEPSFDRSFNNDYGGTNGDWFTVWTTNFVYFPVCYDGAEWAGSVQRNPVEPKIANKHVGGG